MSDWNASNVRDLERSSIREFVSGATTFLTGNVLDFGSGKQPYREIVEGCGGKYTPFDRIDHPASITLFDEGPDFPLDLKWDAILCNQMIQYVPDVPLMISKFKEALADRGGYLVMTYPTCWDIIEPEDLWRFTPSGIEHLLRNEEFEIIRHERRAEIVLGGFKFCLGGGVVARAKT